MEYNYNQGDEAISAKYPLFLHYVSLKSAPYKNKQVEGVKQDFDHV